jgi:hypothetical protein
MIGSSLKRQVQSMTKPDTGYDTTIRVSSYRTARPNAAPTPPPRARKNTAVLFAAVALAVAVAVLVL